MIHTFPTSSVIPSLHHKTHSHLQIPPTTTPTSNVSGFLHCAASDGNRKTSSKWAVLRSNDPDIVVANGCIDSATSVVRKFYEGINCRGLALVEDLVAQNCVYEDLIFPKPFVGRKVWMLVLCVYGNMFSCFFPSYWFGSVIAQVLLVCRQSWSFSTSSWIQSVQICSLQSMIYPRRMPQLLG